MLFLTKSGNVSASSAWLHCLRNTFQNQPVRILSVPASFIDVATRSQARS
jgi:hypothetical protein